MFDFEDLEPLNDSIVIDAQCGWLEEVKHHYANHEWLTANRNKLYKTILRALIFDPAVDCAIEALVLVYPHYALTSTDFRRWSLLLQDALVQAQNIKDNTAQTQLWMQIGQGFILSGNYKTARGAFENALRRAEESEVMEMVMAAYIGLLEIQSLRHANDFMPGLVGNALKFSEQVSSLQLKAALHQVLAIIYTQRGEIRQALEHGQMAYAYWGKLDNKMEMDRMAYIMAHAYRVIWRIDLAERFLDLMTHAQYARHDGLRFYLKGVIRLDCQDYRAALKFLSSALEKFVQLELPHHIASTYHALGLAQTGLRQYGEARLNLEIATRLWLELENTYEYGSALQALGYLEVCEGKKMDARNKLAQALDICKKLLKTPLRQELEELIWETIDEAE